MYVFRLLDLRYEQNVLLNLARQGAGKWPTTRSAVSCKIAEKLPPYATHVLYNLIRYYINVSFHKIPQNLFNCQSRVWLYSSSYKPVVLRKIEQTGIVSPERYWLDSTMGIEL